MNYDRVISAILLFAVITSLTILCAMNKLSPTEMIGVIVSLVGGFIAGKGISGNGGRKALAIAALAPLATGCWMSGDNLKTAVDTVRKEVTTCLSRCAEKAAVKLMSNQCNFKQALDDASDCAHACAVSSTKVGTCKLEELK